MKKKIGSCYNSGIIYIKPEYREGMGDVTRVRTKTNSIVFNKSIQSTIKNIARFLFFDLDESKRYYKELLGKGKNLPLVFDEDNIFICVKSRIPTKRNDGAMTYINPKYIKEHTCGKIALTNGETLKVLCSDQTIKRQIRDTVFIERDLLYLHQF